MRRRTKTMYPVVEKGFVVFAFLYFLNAVLLVLRNPDDLNLYPQASDIYTFALQTAVYLFALLFMVPVRGRIWRAIRMNPVLLSLLVLILASSLWSEVPLFTFRRGLVLAATTLFGFYFGTRYDSGDQLRLVAYAFSICALLSIVFIVAAPRYGFDIGKHSDAWRGVFVQKNMLGRCMVAGITTFWCLRPREIREAILKYFMIVTMLCLLIGSLSAGSYTMMVISIFLIFLYRALRIYQGRSLVPVAVTSGTVLLLGALFARLNQDAILKILGKSSTLTGRVPMWRVLFVKASQRPWLGYGFNGFWSTHNRGVWDLLHWKPLVAHNGYLDLTLELGLLGLGIFALNTAIVARRSMTQALVDRTSEAQWPLLMLSQILLYSLFESGLVAQNNFNWIIYAAIAVSTQRAWQPQKSIELAGITDAPLPSTMESVPCPQS